MAKVYEFRGDWFTSEDADSMSHPHDIAGKVEADDLRGAIDAAEKYFAVDGEKVVVRSMFQVISAPSPTEFAI